MAMKCHELHHFQLRRFAASPLRRFAPAFFTRSVLAGRMYRELSPLISACKSVLNCWMVARRLAWLSDLHTETVFQQRNWVYPKVWPFWWGKWWSTRFLGPYFLCIPEDHLALFHVQLGHNSSWPWLHHSGFLAWKWQTKVKPSPNLGLWKSLAWNLPNDLW